MGHPKIRKPTYMGLFLRVPFGYTQMERNSVRVHWNLCIEYSDIFKYKYRRRCFEFPLILISIANLAQDITKIVCCIDNRQEISYNISTIRLKGANIMQNTSITIRTDKEIKDQVKSLYAALGMDLTTAVNVFFRQSLLRNGMPFEISLDVPNTVTLAAFEEGDKMINDPAAPRYSSVERLFEDLMN